MITDRKPGELLTPFDPWGKPSDELGKEVWKLLESPRRPNSDERGIDHYEFVAECECVVGRHVGDTCAFGVRDDMFEVQE